MAAVGIFCSYSSIDTRTMQELAAQCSAKKNQGKAVIELSEKLCPPTLHKSKALNAQVGIAASSIWLSVLLLRFLPLTLVLLQRGDIPNFGA